MYSSKSAAKLRLFSDIGKENGKIILGSFVKCFAYAMATKDKRRLPNYSSQTASVYVGERILR